MRNLLFISVCLLSTVTYGQSNKFTFKLGDEYELPRKTEDLAFFGNPANGIINLSLKKDELNVLRFDPTSLAQTDDKIISLPEATKNFNSETVTDFRNGNYYWIHSDWDKESSKEYLYYDKIDVSSAKFASQNNKMIEAAKIAGVSENTKNGPIRGFGGFGKAFDFKVVDKYKYNYSADHKLLLVSYRLIPEDRDDKVNHDKIGLVVFDDNMNKLWSNEFTMPYTEAIMDNSDYSIDSKGNAYLLAKVYNDDHRREKDKETGKADYNYEVLRFTKDSKEILHSPVGIGDFFIKDASLVESTTHDMIVACTYSKKAKGDKTDGVFLAALNKDGKVVKYKNGYYEFPVADLEKFESERQQRKMEKKDDYEAPNLVVRDIVVQGNGSIFLTCEEYFVYYKSSSDAQGNTYYYNEYHYENIIAARIKASGEFDWVRKVPKRQMGIDGTSTLGFQLVADSSGYYFLYNDLKKNLELTDDEAPKYYKEGGKGDVIVSKLDNSGNLIKTVLFDTKEEEVQIHPKEFSRLDGSHLIGRAIVKRNRFKPLLITIN
jgi:hypothetical protein